MAKAYDEFDNLIFQTEGEIMSEKDKKTFTKEIMDQFYKDETSRMEIYKTELRKFENLEEIGDCAREAGLKLRNNFSMQAEEAEIETTDVPIITGATVTRKED